MTRHLPRMAQNGAFSVFMVIVVQLAGDGFCKIAFLLLLSRLIFVVFFSPFHFLLAFFIFWNLNFKYSVAKNIIEIY